MAARSRLFAGVVLAVATALATIALAQTRGKPPAKPVRPAAAKTDAQASTDEPATGADAAGAALEPPPAPEMLDGGGRASPLNPAPQELPSSVQDAGVVVDYDRLLADIAALRARIAAVGENLYPSRVAVALQTEGDHAKIVRLAVSLDDGVVYTAPSPFAAPDPIVVYDHAVAPGRHAVAVDVERKDDREEAFRTSQRSRFAIDVPRDHRLELRVSISDDSSMGKDFPADKSGRYDLRVRVKAVAKPVGK